MNGLHELLLENVFSRSVPFGVGNNPLLLLYVIVDKVSNVGTDQDTTDVKREIAGVAFRPQVAHPPGTLEQGERPVAGGLPLAVEDHPVNHGLYVSELAPLPRPVLRAHPSPPRR